MAFNPDSIDIDLEQPALTEGPQAIQPGTISPAVGVPVHPEQLGSNWYSASKFQSRYDWDYGLLQAPVDGPPGTSPDIIRVHGGASQRVIKWFVERVGAPPRIPSTNTNNPNEVLIRKTITPQTPAMGANGKRIYRIDGVYVYLLVQTPGDQDRLSTGSPPYDAQPSVLNDVTAGQYDPALLDSSSTVPAAGVPNIKDVLGY